MWRQHKKHFALLYGTYETENCGDLQDLLARPCLCRSLLGFRTPIRLNQAERSEDFNKDSSTQDLIRQPIDVVYPQQLRPHDYGHLICEGLS